MNVHDNSQELLLGLLGVGRFPFGVGVTQNPADPEYMGLAFDGVGFTVEIFANGTQKLMLPDADVRLCV